MKKAIYDYKVHGHILIDMICQYGYSKNEVYSWLEKKLKHNWRHAHFSNVHHEWQAQIVIQRLREMLDTARQKYPNKNRVPNSSRPKARSKDEMLSSEDIKKALKQINNRPASLWLRIKKQNCLYCKKEIPEQKLKQSTVPVKYCTSQCGWRYICGQRGLRGNE